MQFWLDIDMLDIEIISKQVTVTLMDSLNQWNLSVSTEEGEGICLGFVGPQDGKGMSKHWRRTMNSKIHVNMIIAP